jgi:hypothetical protein
MHTIKLNVSDSIYNELIVLLTRFSKEEIEIISDEENFTVSKNYLNLELEDLKSGKATFYTVDEATVRIEKTIQKYENPS